MFVTKQESLLQNRPLRKSLQIGFDYFCGLFSVLTALYLSGLTLSLSSLLAVIVIIPLVRSSLQFFLGSYRLLWRYTSRKNIQNVMINTFVVAALLNLSRTLGATLNVEFIVYEASLFFVTALSLRALRSFFYRPPLNVFEQERDSFKRVLFIGAGLAANSLLTDMRRTKVPLTVVGCLDDDESKIGADLQDVPVLGKISRAEYFIRTLNIEKVIVVIPSAKPERLQQIVSDIRRLHVDLKVIPSLRELMKNKGEQLSFNITLNDLLDAKEFQEKNPVTHPHPDTVLITGGAGYIGLHLTKRFLDAGKKVRILENFSFGVSFLPGYLDHPNLEIIRGDIANISDVVKAVKGVHTIVALAAIVGDPACSINPEETLNINYEATKVLIETANFYGVKRLIFASSCSVYGESDKEMLTETSLLNPVSLYAKTRIMSEDVIFSRCGNVEPVVLRLSTVFGYSLRMRYDLVVNTLTVRALVDKKFKVFGGNQWRPFVHCSDVAKAFYLAALAPSEKVAGQVFNVGSTDMNFTISQVGDAVHKLIPDAEYITSTDVDDPRNYKVDFTKIKTVLGFEKDYSIEDGIQEIISKIQESPYLKNYTETIYSNLQVQQHRYIQTEG